MKKDFKLLLSLILKIEIEGVISKLNNMLIFFDYEGFDESYNEAIKDLNTVLISIINDIAMYIKKLKESG